jgi:hypothetical protein
MEEEDLPFLSRCPPFPAATEPNSDVHDRILQTFQALNSKSNQNKLTQKFLHQVFFFFCTLSKKHNLNQPAFSQRLLQLPYLPIFWQILFQLATK